MPAGRRQENDGGHGRKGKAKVLEVPQQVWRKYGFIMLWGAVGLDLIISTAGYPMLGQAVSAMLVMFYLLDHVSVRRVVCSFWFAIIDLFFREISVGGDSKLEPLKDGRAVIFVCAPHVNQFLDPIVVMKVVAEQTRRHVSWMVANKSMDRKFIGAFARAMKGIPVDRPDDMETSGPGFVTVEGTAVKGHGGTRFTKNFAKGAVLVIKKGGAKATAKVALVLSDTEMTMASRMQSKAAKPVEANRAGFNRALSPAVTTILVVVNTMVIFGLISLKGWLVESNQIAIAVSIAFCFATLVTQLVYAFVRDGVPHSSMVGEYYRGYHDSIQGDKKASPGDGTEDLSTCVVDHNFTEKCAYSYQPYVDQTKMFEKVHQHLEMGGTIGIFPEGGTHDGTQVLPLKWGVSVMLLGALAKHIDTKHPLKVSVVPVGLNYFAPHKFRSTVSVDFGEPIDIPAELVYRFRDGTKEEKNTVFTEIMGIIMTGVKSCTLQAKDMETLHLFRALRRIYVPRGTRLSLADNVAITQGIAHGFEKVKEDPQVKTFMQDLSIYSRMLLEYRVRDHQVQRFKDNAISPNYRLFLIQTTFLRLATLMVTSLCLLPWWLSCAPAGLVGRVIADLQARKVKKMSVIGTWKVLIATAAMPVLHMVYTTSIWLAFGQTIGLVWFFFAPLGGVMAIYATEDGIRMMQSLNALLLLLGRKDIGTDLFHMREKLKNDLLKLQEEQQWITGLDETVQASLKHNLESGGDGSPPGPSWPAGQRPKKKNAASVDGSSEDED
mmetsp:Transcript_35139/g.79980  ORF Transcript_35139/g.79980 Transcript_35139/m.79980 type:complete len:774 (+) Transcript_35139:33-2354(+)